LESSFYKHETTIGNNKNIIVDEFEVADEEYFGSIYDDYFGKITVVL